MKDHESPVQVIFWVPDAQAADFQEWVKHAYPSAEFVSSAYVQQNTD